MVIPSYCKNSIGKKYLIYALKNLEIAIKKAKMSEYEIILFDNHSTIEINDIPKIFPNLNIKYYKSNNPELLPVHKSWSEAVSCSNGEYIFIHSDDDFVYEDFFIEIYKQMKNDNEIELFYWRAKGMTNEFYDVTEFCWYWNWPLKQSGYFVPSVGFLRHPMASSGWIAKRNFYEKFGLIHEEGADYNLSIRFTIHIKKAYFCFNSISAYRHHDNQGNKVDEPTDEEAIGWRLDTTKIFYNFFDKETAKQKSFEYIKYYAWLHGFKHIVDANILSNSYEQSSKLGRFLFGNFWNKLFYKLYKNYFTKINKEEFMLKDIKISQPDFKIK